MNNELRIAAVAAALCLGIVASSAQEPVSLQTLQKQLEDMRRQFTEQQRLHAHQLELMQQQIDTLNRKADALPPKTISQPAPLDPTDISSVTSDAVAPSPPTTANAGELERRRWRPSDPIGIRRGQASLDLGLTGTFVVGGSTANDLDELNGGGHDPNARGFTVQAVEANFSGAIDPYFQGSANLNFAIAADGESFVEVEEAWLESLALPLNLQLRAGQIWSDVGRHNPTHIHSWGFVDQPLAVSRLLGPDGMRNPGARLSWLAPTPWHTELSFAVQNSGGQNASSFRGSGHSHGGGEEEGIPFGFRHQENDRGVRSPSDMLINPRIEMSFDLTDTQTVLFGGSAAMGPNNSGEGGETDTYIYGADLTWKWQARDHNQGYPFVSLQSEFLARRYEAGFFDWDEDANGGDGDGNGFVDEGLLTDPATGLPAVLTPETIADYGLYSQLLYGFRPNWIAGLRFGYVFGGRTSYEGRGLGVADNAGGIDALAHDSERGDRFRVSPNLTWRPSEYSKIRLQYNYDDRDKIGIDHSLWLQMEMSLGAHGAHQF